MLGLFVSSSWSCSCCCFGWFQSSGGPNILPSHGGPNIFHRMKSCCTISCTTTFNFFKACGHSLKACCTKSYTAISNCLKDCCTNEADAEHLAPVLPLNEVVDEVAMTGIIIEQGEI